VDFQTGAGTLAPLKTIDFAATVCQNDVWGPPGAPLAPSKPLISLQLSAKMSFGQFQKFTPSIFNCFRYIVLDT
jgi:hypothetical protein